ncbi:hypothetical protein LMG28614_07162 [Paraburkholderia ultramafica]|uniref:Uncharacterized protein n=1 Tax=Paraburkholderia ultramafica TaxID=1544867 RepID=A0A6S7BRG5_9BURK|nr:hypothetical protein [Paraburkholderia ultramafica]CAB3809910.1 hypothetical protein LMG28614_07162 [Paraburkholderia ultramafica]
MALDLKAAVDVFAQGISSSVKTVTGQDIRMLAGFSQTQLQSIAQQSALVAGMIEANAFTVAERKFYLDGLGQMARGFVDTFVQLAEVVIEKLYNAVVNAIYESINGLAGVALVAPFAAV